MQRPSVPFGVVAGLGAALWLWLKWAPPALEAAERAAERAGEAATGAVYAGRRAVEARAHEAARQAQGEPAGSAAEAAAAELRTPPLERPATAADGFIGARVTAGVLEEDLHQSLDGARVLNPDDARAPIVGAPGSPVSLILMRAGTPQTVQAVRAQ